MKFSFIARILSQATPLLVVAVVSLALSTGCTEVYSTSVDSEQKINQTEGNFNSALADGDRFGSAITNIGDLEGDGVIDLAVGAAFDDDGGTDRGAVWILFMDDNGQVDQERKISTNQGSFAGTLANNDHFGSSVATIGDLNNDGITDLAVGAPGDDEGGTDRGALWILFLNSDGTVQSERKIANNLSGLGDVLNNNDQFGTAVTNIGDLNNDGITDLAVGTPLDDDGGVDFGALWILFMNNDGSVASSQKISFSAGGFAGDLFTNDRFGYSLDAIGDFDQDGVPELAVGTPGDDDGGTNRGAVWILYLNSIGTVKKEVKISQTSGKFDDIISIGSEFGSTVTNLGDFNNDGITELGVGARLSDDGGIHRGAFWVIFLEADAEVRSSSKISDLHGNFNGTLADGDQFGSDLVSIGDLDLDGIDDIAVTASGDSVNGSNRGAVWILFMAPVEIGARVDKDADMATLFGGGQ